MAIFYLVRHGEATAIDERLKSAQLIVASPYTRALETAAIISRETGLKICVEVDLHEWEPDKTNQYTTSEEAFKLTREFNLYKGVYPEGQCMKWETLAEVRQRMRKVADKYADYDKVIFVGHGMAFRTLTYIEQMKPAEIIECTYTIGQEDCIYSFC